MKRLGYMKEDKTRLIVCFSTDSHDQPAENEKHKQDQLNKVKEGNNHWKPELASNSEEAVRCYPLPSPMSIGLPYKNEYWSSLQSFLEIGLYVIYSIEATMPP